MSEERIFKVRSIFILVLVLLGFGGCRSQPPEPITIRMVAGAGGKKFEGLEDQVAQFEARHPTIQVQVLDHPESTRDRHAGQPPTRLAAYDHPEVPAATPYLEDRFEVLIRTGPRPVHPPYSEISEVIQQEVHLILTGQQQPAAAAAKMAAAIQSLVSIPPGEADR